MTKTVLTFRPIYFSRIFYSTYWNGKNSVLAHIWTFSKFWYNWMDFILHWSNMFQIKSTKVLIFHLDFDYQVIPKYVQRSMLVKFQFLMEILVWNFDRIFGQLGQNFGFSRNWFKLYWTFTKDDKIVLLRSPFGHLFGDICAFFRDLCPMVALMGTSDALWGTYRVPLRTSEALWGNYKAPLGNCWGITFGDH